MTHQVAITDHGSFANLPLAVSAVGDTFECPAGIGWKVVARLCNVIESEAVTGHFVKVEQDLSRYCS